MGQITGRYMEVAAYRGWPLLEVGLSRAIFLRLDENGGVHLADRRLAELSVTD